MKRKGLFFGMIVMALVFGMMTVGCGGGPKHVGDNLLDTAGRETESNGEGTTSSGVASSGTASYSTSEVASSGTASYYAPASASIDSRAQTVANLEKHVVDLEKLVMDLTAAEAAAKTPTEIDALRARRDAALRMLADETNLNSQNIERVGWSEMTSIPNKDFESRGIVVFIADKGRVVTSTDLMIEARKVGADDIINVRIYTERDTRGGVLSSSGSATAIKYTGQGLNEIVITKDEKDGAKAERIIDRKIGGAGTYGN